MISPSLKDKVKRSIQQKISSDIEILDYIPVSGGCISQAFKIITSDRDLFLKNLAESKKLPDLKDISGLWVELVKEIRNAESIKTFNTNVLSADGDNSELEVLRIGTFSITHNGMFLKHLIDTNQIEFLPSQPSGVNKRKLKRLQNNAPGMYEVDIDPTRGAILE